MFARLLQFVLLPALAAAALTATAAQRVVATINDPAGDDDGDGSLVYPQRSDFRPGDLDLVSLRISRGDDTYDFEVTLRNAVRDPASVPADSGSETLADFARRGFYAFNLDIYVDLDRIAGSGNTFTLPGRKAVIDPAFAWERAIVLTPRPELMRQQLIDAIVESDAGARRDDVTARSGQCISTDATPSLPGASSKHAPSRCLVPPTTFSTPAIVLPGPVNVQFAPGCSGFRVQSW